MIGRRVRVWAAVIVGATGFAACAPDDGADVAALAEGDSAELARTVALATVGLRGETVSLSGEVEGVGSCTWGWQIAGPSTGAAFDASVTAPPCGGSVEGLRASLVYTVDGGTLTGTVAASGDDWTYDLSGSRDATAVISTLRGGERTLEAHWTLVSMAGTTDGLSAGAFTADLVYDGPADGVWELVWSVDADDAATGTLTGPSGSVCSVSGTRYDLVVDCAA